MQLWQLPLSDDYLQRDDDQLAEAIAARKAELGNRLVILGHHYQADEVIRFADFTGDSFKLSQLAAEKVAQVGARYVVFCGVHFMAESADILTPEGTEVILPDMGAGCSMADMATLEETVEAWAQLQDVLGDIAPGTGTNAGPKPFRVVPICYMNSSAAIKAFCGEHGGAVCTSSNAASVIRWALAGGAWPLNEGERVKILFLPDQHLGRNTAADLGFDVDTPWASDPDMAVWDPRHVDGLGGLDEETLERVTFLLWKGHCSVHKLFRPEHVDQAREAWPDVTVIVHPECEYEVCQKADMTGSTEGILRAIREAPEGSRWAVGTEVHMVNRIAQEAKERGVSVRMLSECQCLCTTMYRIDLPHLLWVLDELVRGRVVNRISVDANTRHWAMVALERMLEITASSQPITKKPHAATALG